MEENQKLDLILEKLELLEKKIQDNNSILHSERNGKRWAKLFWLVKWILIITSGIIAWSYIEPIYQSTIDNYNKTIETANKAGAALDKIPSVDELKKIGGLENLKEKIEELKK